MKFLLLLIGLLPLLAAGQTTQQELHSWTPPYQLNTPAGWTTERFPIPISFAPQIPYKGVEDIRFTPKWGKADSPDYWSYVYLWWLEGKPDITAAGLQANLTAYYSGLIAQNIKSNPQATNKQVPTPTVIINETTTSGKKGYSGSITMLDYMSQRELTLNCLIHITNCPEQNRTAVIIELSPQAVEHAVWKELHAIERDFACRKQ